MLLTAFTAMALGLPKQILLLRPGKKFRLKILPIHLTLYARFATQKGARHIVSS
jgi:hypothetical protein